MLRNPDRFASSSARRLRVGQVVYFPDRFTGPFSTPRPIVPRAWQIVCFPGISGTDRYGYPVNDLRHCAVVQCLANPRIKKTVAQHHITRYND